MITEAIVRKFISIRNRSSFNTNLQFQIDADMAGLQLSELPEAEKGKDSDEFRYRWRLSFGVLEETRTGRLRLVKEVADGRASKG